MCDHNPIFKDATASLELEIELRLFNVWGWLKMIIFPSQRKRRVALANSRQPLYFINTQDFA